MDLAKSPIYIAGVAETALGKVPDQTELSMFAAAAREALQEAGMILKDVDGLFTPFMGWSSSMQVAEYLGIQPSYADSSDHGGGQFEAMVMHAVSALAAGQCEVALIGFASRQRSSRSRTRDVGTIVSDQTSTAQFEAPYGCPIPIGHFALAAARHMHLYGTTSEQLAEVAVTARKWAQLNPKAWNRDPLTVQEVLGSTMLCDPIHKLDMCLITDGGGAAVITTAERARDAQKKPLRIIGIAESISHFHVWTMDDLTVWPGAVSGPAAFQMAGIEAQDVDVLQPYDASTIAVLIELEDLGFCGRGESGPMVAEGTLAPGGRLPAMTSGGGLSYNHPGAFGMQLLIEAVRQGRGEAGERQVPDVEISVAHGIGGMYSMASTVVLAKD